MSAKRSLKTAIHLDDEGLHLDGDLRVPSHLIKAEQIMCEHNPHGVSKITFTLLTTAGVSVQLSERTKIDGKEVAGGISSKIKEQAEKIDAVSAISKPIVLTAEVNEKGAVAVTAPGLGREEALDVLDQAVYASRQCEQLRDKIRRKS